MRRVPVDPVTPAADVLEVAAAAIRGGGLVVLPTDTLYGLAADPFSRSAVHRVFSLKGRQPGQALPLIACDSEQVARTVGKLSGAARALADRFWPGPLTLLLLAPDTIAVEATGGTGRIGVRVPNHHVAVALCRVCNRPLTATSANLSGQPPSSDPAVVAGGLATVEDQIDVMLDAGPTPGGAPSTVVDVSGAEPRLVRAGAVPWNEIQACLNLPPAN
jgi:L-threonylcarbamoyladenylate synthase